MGLAGYSLLDASAASAGAGAGAYQPRGIVFDAIDRILRLEESAQEPFQGLLANYFDSPPIT